MGQFLSQLIVEVMTHVCFHVYLLYNKSISFRLYLPASLWIEWLVCVPLMAFLSVFVDDMRNFSRLDCAVITLLGFTILFGFIVTFGLSFHARLVMIVFSFVSYGAAAFIVFLRDRKKYQMVETDVEAADVEFRSLQRMHESIHDKKLARLLMYVLPPFPIIYILGDTGMLSNDVTYIAFICVNILAKCIHVSAATGIQSSYLQSQLEAMQSAKNAARDQLMESELAASDARRKFLRFVFHEVRWS